jgi:hypothetical protein
MDTRTLNRTFAWCGIGSVVLSLGGLFLAIASGAPFVTLGSNTAHIAHSFDSQTGTGVWAGQYLEVLSLGAFLAFAVWASKELGDGLLGAIARTAATAYATVTAVSLCVQGVGAFRAGHGMSAQLVVALSDLSGALLVGSWFMFAFFLLAAGSLALSGAHRRLGWSALAIAALTLAGGALPTNDLGQWSGWFWYIWIVSASISLARSEPAPAAALAVA